MHPAPRSTTVHHVVATSGTSGLLGANVGASWLKTNAPSYRSMPVEEVLAAWSRALPAVEDPKRVSAEYSLLHALRTAQRLGPRPNVVMVHSDTADGSLAAAMVARLMERDFNARVHLRCAVELDAARPAELQRSLGAFMNELAAALLDGDPAVTCFAPLGGYKVMTSLACLTGAFLGFPAVYLHETMQVLHEVPAVPLRVDDADLTLLAPLMRRAASGVEMGSLDPSQRAQVTAFPWLFDDADDRVVLNAFGHFLRGLPRYQDIFEPRVNG